MLPSPEQSFLVKYAFQAIFALLGLLVTMNSFFIQKMIDDISINTKNMAEAIKGLEVSTAVVKSELDTYKEKQSWIVSRIYDIERILSDVHGRLILIENAPSRELRTQP